MKYGLAFLAFILVLGTAALVYFGAMPGLTVSYKKNVKMTVVVQTPDGDIAATAVREISNSKSKTSKWQQRWPHGGNPAEVRGEAVVIDLGERGILFALINENVEAAQFYRAFPPPNNRPTSIEAMEYYDQLPIGTKATLNPETPPGYPKFVTFTDSDDPTSITLAQEWERRENGLYEIKADHIETLFGKGVKLKEITLEITDAPVTLNFVKKHLPKIFLSNFDQWWKVIDPKEKMRLSQFYQFKTGVKQ